MVPLVAVLTLGSIFISTPTTQEVSPREQGPNRVTCQPLGPPAQNPDLPEGSGVAASRGQPEINWAHNDSGEPVLLKLDNNGATLGRVRVTGAEVDDWEDIAVGRCGERSCIYIGDIGDNDGEREHITIYRVPEPSSDASESAAADALKATYPDGKHDAESLFVLGDGEIFIVTKGGPGPVALYRLPRQTPSGAIARLERVGEARDTGDVSSDDRPSAADASPDGNWIVIRTTAYASLYRAADLITGRWEEVSRVDLRALKEPLGEGITFGAKNTLIVVGEGGGDSRPGTFARLTCTFPQ